LRHKIQICRTLRAKLLTSLRLAIATDLEHCNP
jgi:hypothetical protein